MPERETIYERISELRKDKGFTQKKLCEIAGITTTQLNRIENGRTEAVSSGALVKLSKALNVSSDYLFGLTFISTPKNYDISALGLSESAVKGMITGTVDVQMLNKLIEHERFRYLLTLMRSYFDNSIARGNMERNAIIDTATAMLGDFVKENPAHRNEVQSDRNLLKSQKLAEYEAELEKIKSTFITVIKDIKKDISDGKPQETPATKEFLHTIQEQAKNALQERKSIQAEDMADIVANMVETALPLDGKSADLFKQLAEHLFTERNE